MNRELSLDQRVRRARVAVLGDFALDAHWELAATDPRSVETGLPVRQVAQQRWELGGAARVAKHLSQLRVQRAVLVGAVGRDLFARPLLDLLALSSLRSGSLQRRSDWSTLVYGKPRRAGSEMERLDFGTWTAPSATLRAAVLHHLGAALRRSHLVILNQQVDPGLLCEATATDLNALIAAHPRHLFLADCRARLAHLNGVIAKCNVAEAQALLTTQAAEPRDLARALAERFPAGAFVSAAAAGLAWAHSSHCGFVAALPLPSGAASCGAGDALTAALGAALAVGAEHEAAARFAMEYVAAYGP